MQNLVASGLEVTVFVACRQMEECMALWPSWKMTVFVCRQLEECKIGVQGYLALLKSFKVMGGVPCSQASQSSQPFSSSQVDFVLLYFSNNDSTFFFVLLDSESHPYQKPLAHLKSHNFAFCNADFSEFLDIHHRKNHNSVICKAVCYHFNLAVTLKMRLTVKQICFSVFLLSVNNFVFCLFPCVGSGRHPQSVQPCQQWSTVSGNLGDIEAMFVSASWHQTASLSGTHRTPSFSVCAVCVWWGSEC